MTSALLASDGSAGHRKLPWSLCILLALHRGVHHAKSWGITLLIASPRGHPEGCRRLKSLPFAPPMKMESAMNAPPLLFQPGR